MSNSGVNAGFAKCFILFMAVVILLQGVVYLGLSIWGITLRQCSKETSDINNRPFQFAMDIVYFLNKNCGNPSVKVTNISEPVTLDVDFNIAEQVESRTFIFFIAYAVISTLWIVTSLAIITTLCGPITKNVKRLCFWPWFLTIMAGCTLDAVATGYHIYDVINTTTVVKTFEYLGISANKKALEVLSNFDAYFITPAVLMTCISSRVVLIWLLNIFGSSFCLSLSNTLSKMNSSKQSSITSLATTSTTPVTNLEQQQREVISSEQTQEQQHASILNTQSTTALPALRIPSSHKQSSTSLQTSHIQQSAASLPTSSLNDTQGSNNYNTSVEYSNGLNYSQQSNISPYQQELSPTSPLNNRYSTNYDNFQFPAQNQRVSEELRGQLPWSYTSMATAVPKKTQMQVYPEIPAPDYGH